MEANPQEQDFSQISAGYIPCCASPAGGRQHGAGGHCCSTGPANFVGSPGAADQMARPSLRMAGGVSCHAAGRFHRGGGLSFSLCSRSPWRARQKPLIAGIACNGAALHVFCVVSHVTPQRQTPGGLPSRRASFFQGVSPCAKMIARSGKKSGKNWTQGKTSSDGQPPSSCSWLSVCLAASTITPPNRPCARPPSSASRGSVHVLQ